MTNFSKIFNKTNQIILPVNPTQAVEFYRVIYL